MSIPAAVAIGISVLIGAILQRLSGMGLALVAAPVLAVVVGPISGIFVMNAAGLVSSCLILLTVITDVQWRRYFLMLPGIVVGAVVGSVVVRAVPSSWLQIIIGALVLIALATTFRASNLGSMAPRFLTPMAGAASGLFSTAAGVSSPPMVIYARLTNWSQRPFAATLQPVFITTATAAIITKIGLGAVPVTLLPPWWIYLSIIAAILSGITIGQALRHRISTYSARIIAITIAALGSAAAVMRGVLML